MSLVTQWVRICRHMYTLLVRSIKDLHNKAISLKVNQIAML